MAQFDPNAPAHRLEDIPPAFDWDSPAEKAVKGGYDPFTTTQAKMREGEAAAREIGALTLGRSIAGMAGYKTPEWDARTEELKGKLLGTTQEGLMQGVVETAPIAAVSMAVPSAAGAIIGKAAPAVGDFIAGSGGGESWLGRFLSKQLFGTEATTIATAGTYKGSDESFEDQYKKNLLVGVGIPAAVEAAGAGLRTAAPLIPGVKGFMERNLGGDILNEYAKGARTFTGPPLPGMQRTAGEALNNPDLMALETAFAQRPNSQMRTFLDNARATNNRIVRDAIGNVGDTGVDAAQNMSDAIEQAESFYKKAYQAAWKAAGIDVDKTRMPIGALRTTVDQMVKDLPEAYKDLIPPKMLQVMDRWGSATTIAELQALRSETAAAAAEIGSKGNSNGARVVGNFARTIADYTDQLLDPALNAMGGATIDKALYDAARRATAQYHALFTRPAGIRKALGTDQYGADKLPVSATSTEFLKPKQARGSPEALESYLRAVGNDPAGLQAARDAFAQRFMQSVETTTPSATGEHMISASKVTKFLKDFDHVVKSRLFTQDQRDAIYKIRDATDLMERRVRSIPKGGPDTAAKLMGNTYLDVLIGPSGAKLFPFMLGGASAAATHLLGGTGVETVGTGLAGLLGGGYTHGKVMEALYGSSRENVLGLLDKALRNPQLASDLMQRIDVGPKVDVAKRIAIALGVPSFDLYTQVRSPVQEQPPARGLINVEPPMPTAPIGGGG